MKIHIKNMVCDRCRFAIQGVVRHEKTGDKLYGELEMEEFAVSITEHSR